MRDAITQANMAGSTIAEIDFNITGTGVQTINLTSALPALNAPNAVYINGLSQGGTGNTVPLIELNGAATTGDGLQLSDAGNTVSGLIIEGFTNGIEVGGANNSIGGAAAGAGNILSGNTKDGLLIDSVASGVVVQGNFIGTNTAGSAALANSGNGIEVVGSKNTIGGTTSSSRNIISGNTADGVILDSGASGVVVQGNYIGTDVTGATAVGNSIGIVANNTSNNIGGTATGAGNTISGNSGDGVLINASGVTVQGNYIGIDATGAKIIANYDGIEVSSSNNTIGGTVTGARNVISGNSLFGVLIDSGISGVSVQGNFIGTNATGSAGLTNSRQYDGVEVYGSNNAIGGTNSGARNVISGNTNYGVFIISTVSGVAASGNQVLGNYIGTNAAATGTVPNLDGIAVNYGNNTIGGTTTGAGNVISGNSGNGITTGNDSPTDNGILIQGNYIGINAAGTSAVANGGDGILVGASYATIGGTVLAARNIISGNRGDGVLFYYNANVTSYNQVLGNYIGTNTAGASALPNSVGVHVNGVNNTIGGTVAGSRNVISGNLNDGVLIDSAATGNVVMGDFVGTNYNGNVQVANRGNGIEVAGTRNTIGSSISNALLNIISGNSLDGVLLDSTASGTLIAHSYIGLAVNDSALANSSNGVEIQSINNKVGGNDITSIGYRDWISGNMNDGVLIDSGATGNLVQGDVIGLDNRSATAVPNGAYGVSIADSNNTIGGTVSGVSNTIADNTSGGVLVSAGSGDTIRQNSIYANGPSNTGLGITLSSGANNNIGAPTLNSATLNGSTLTVTGTFNAPTANVSYVLEFFANLSGDPEGRVYLGSLTVTPTSTGTQHFTFTTTYTGTDPLITATLTDNLGDTSEFSNGVTD